MHIKWEWGHELIHRQIRNYGHTNKNKCSGMYAKETTIIKAWALYFKDHETILQTYIRTEKEKKKKKYDIPIN